MNNTTNKTEKANPVILLIIDPQVDFHEGGSLAVGLYFLTTHYFASIKLGCIHFVTGKWCQS